MHITINPKPNVKDIIPLLLNWVYVTREGQSEARCRDWVAAEWLVPGLGVAYAVYAVICRPGSSWG